MGIVAVKIRLMPESPETDLEELKSKIKEVLEGAGAKNLQLSEDPVAFGLKAIIAFFAWSEDSELDPVENKLREIDGIVSGEITDMRRAFG